MTPGDRFDWTKNLSPTRTCHLTIASNKLFATRGTLLTPPLLKEQKRIFERQLQKRDEQLDKILKGMERNVNPEQIPRYEIYCNVR